MHPCKTIEVLNTFSWVSDVKKISTQRGYHIYLTTLHSYCIWIGYVILYYTLLYNKSFTVIKVWTAEFVSSPLWHVLKKMALCGVLRIIFPPASITRMVTSNAATPSWSPLHGKPTWTTEYIKPLLITKPWASTCHRFQDLW